VLAFSREHGLTTIPDWHFFTGPAGVLRGVWRAYNVTVSAPNPDADIVHTSVVYFIGADGTERYVAAPMADHTSSGAAYLPANQIADWGQGIAQVAATLLR
jgi:cytochrome oxidase Cu insertion factor (SCO1/SenC/PrrC family)